MLEGEKRKMVEEENIKNVNPRTEEEKKPTTAISLREQQEIEIAKAGELMSMIEALYEDPEKRSQVTGISGASVGTSVNYLLDANEESDPEKRSDLTERGITSGLEILASAAKTIIVGKRRREARKKK